MAGSCSSTPALQGAQLVRQQSVIASVTLLVATKPRFPIVLMSDARCGLPSDFLVRLRAAADHALQVVQVEPFSKAACAGARHRDAYFQPTYGVLRIFSLQWLHAALYLDSDTAVVQNLDHILLALLADHTVEQVRTPQACHSANNLSNLGTQCGPCVGIF